MRFFRSSNLLDISNANLKLEKEIKILLSKEDDYIIKNCAGNIKFLNFDGQLNEDFREIKAFLKNLLDNVFI